jgi:hypothetical protein
MPSDLPSLVPSKANSELPSLEPSELTMALPTGNASQGKVGSMKGGRMKRSAIVGSHDDKDCAKSTGGKGGEGGKAGGKGGEGGKAGGKGGNWRGSRKGGLMKRSIIADNGDMDIVRSVGGKGDDAVGLAYPAKVAATKPDKGDAKTMPRAAVVDKKSGE